MTDVQLLTITLTLLAILGSMLANRKSVEDLRDVLRAELKAEIAEVNSQIKEQGANLTAQIKAQGTDLTAQIKDQRADLTAQIKAQGAELTAGLLRVEAIRDVLFAEMRAQRSEINAALQRIENKLDHVTDTVASHSQRLDKLEGK